MVRCFAVLFFLCSICGEAAAQRETAPSDSTESLRDQLDPSLITNEIFRLTDEDTFGEELQFLLDDIDRLVSQPLDLSTASRQSLQQIPTVTDLDIEKILSSRKGHTALEKEIANNIRMFVRNAPPEPKQHVSLRTRVVLDPNASSQSEYASGSYHGSPIKTLSRILAKNADFLLSFVEAKSPGEPLYFDHLTGCFATLHPLAITDDVLVSQLVVGDYSLSFGSGLLFAKNTLQLSARRVILNPAPRSAGIQPYISSSSFRYFRGAAAEVTTGIFSLSGFFSDRMIDAATDSSGDNITSFPTTGYHRTALELSRKDQAQSKVAGGHIAVTPLHEENFLEFGATAYSLNYDKPVAKKDSLSTAFSGQKHSMISLELRSALSFVAASAEFARMISDAGNANAFAITLLGAPAEWLEFSLNYRHLPNNFISPFGGTFGLNSDDAQNETGWYLASKISVISNKLWFFGSANISESMSKLGSDVHYTDIVFGSEYKMDFLPVDLILQLRSYGRGPALTLSGDSLSKTSLRLDAKSDISKAIRISLRSEFQRTYSVTDNNNENGYLIGIKMHYKPLHELSISSGIQFYKTDSYASRFYSNETDLRGSMPFVALYGNGYRYYLQLAYDIISKFTVSARVAESRYTPTPGSPQLRKATVGVQIDLAL